MNRKFTYVSNVSYRHNLKVVLNFFFLLFTFFFGSTGV
jgi:hypothetical protein